MHTREIAVGQNTLRLETGKLAKQADGSVIVRFGDSVVLVTACRAANPREGIDFLPLTVDYREYTYASGRIPGGFFKREGKPAEKEVLTSRVHRPADPAALPRRAGATRRRSSRSCCRPTSENDTDVLAITGASARSRSRTSRSRRRSPASASASSTASTSSTRPSSSARRASSISIVAGSKDGLVMVEAGAKEVTEEQVVGALEAAHAAIKQIVAVIDDLAKAAGKKKLAVAKKEIAADFYKEIEEKVLVPLAEAMRIRDKLENYETRRAQRSKNLIAALPEDEAEQKADAKAIFKELKEKVLRDEVLTQRRPARRPQVRRNPADLDRDRRPAAHARLGRLHARRNAGARHLHARHGRRCAEDRELRGRDVEELHAPLQLPAVLGRRNRTHDAAPAAAKSATARSPSARSRR